MPVYFADSVHDGEDEMQVAVQDNFVTSMLLSMWDVDAPEAHIERRSEPADKKTRNRLSAQQSRNADNEYSRLMLTELESFTETLQMYAGYIAQVKVHAVDAVDSMQGLEQICAQTKINVARLQESEKCKAAEPMPEIPRKQRNRMHARNSRQRKHDFVQNLIKQRDESWSTLQDVMQYKTALESACSVLNDFDDNGTILLQLTETRQRLLMRSTAHKHKYEELKCKMSYRTIHREKNAS